MAIRLKEPVARRKPRRARPRNLRFLHMTLLLHRGEFEVDGSRLFGGESDFPSLRRDFGEEGSVRVFKSSGPIHGENAVNAWGETGELKLSAVADGHRLRPLTILVEKNNLDSREEIAGGDHSVKRGAIVVKDNFNGRNIAGRSEYKTGAEKVGRAP